MKHDEDQLKKFLQTRFKNNKVEPSKDMFDNIYNGTIHHQHSSNRKIWYSTAAMIIILLGIGSILNYTTKDEKLDHTNSPKVVVEGKRDSITQKKQAIPKNKENEKELVNNDSVLRKINQQKKENLNIVDAPMSETFTSENQLKNVILRDKSTITMQKESQVDFTITNQGNRMVNLNGNVFFDVAKDPKRPFIVQGKHSRIQVTGTSFMMSSQKDNDKITLIEGSVTITHLKTGITKNIIPGQNFIINTTGIVSLKKSPNQFAWKTGNLSYKNTSIGMLMQDLKENYDAKIEVQNPMLLNCSYTGTFKNATPEKVLSILSITLGSQLEKKNNTFVITGNSSCAN